MKIGVLTLLLDRSHLQLMSPLFLYAVFIAIIFSSGQNKQFTVSGSSLMNLMELKFEKTKYNAYDLALFTRHQHCFHVCK